MIMLLETFGLIAACLAFGYWRAPRLVWTGGIALVLLAFSLLSRLPWWELSLFWLVYIPVAAIFNLPHLRQKFVTKPLLTYLKANLPPIGETERIALEAGDVWLDADIFQGKMNWKNIISEPMKALSDEEEHFIEHQVKHLCSMINDWEIDTHADLPKDVWKYIKSERFFGLIIPKQYGGLGFSARAHSTIVSMLATASSTAATTVMVPNSLGPAELLLEYGTDEQKNHYLPRLAKGLEIPCFGLTNPHAGSDAGAIPDYGVVCRQEYQGKETLGIRLSFSKHYITLAPVATIVGIAFYLRDPKHFLGEKVDYGITLALIPADHPGMEIGNRHLPLKMAFMNGPVRANDMFIPMDFIIGGQPMLGQGWRMLMECLSAGRGISLPASATGAAKISYRMTGAYARIRTQFNTSIGNFEGVQEALARIAGFTYLIESTRLLTTHAIDSGLRPSLVAGIAKCHMTELARTAVNDAMDVHGGRAIQAGPRNYTLPMYTAIPVGITVEGANILTRNLIIFGQGAMRCHPYLQAELEALQQSDETLRQQRFDQLLEKHMGYSLSQFTKAFWHGLTGARFAMTQTNGFTAPYTKQLTRMSSALSLTSDLALLFLGGALKRKESLSARLGDVLSHIYMATAAIKFFHDHNCPKEDEATLCWALDYCLYEIQMAFKGFFENFPIRVVGKLMKWVVFPWGYRFKYPSDRLMTEVAKQMQQPTELRERLTQYIALSRDPEDAKGRVELTFEKLIKAEATFSAYQKAIRDDKIDRYWDIDTQVRSLQEQKIIADDEADILIDYLKARDDAVKVDEFSPKQVIEMAKTLLKTGSE